MVLTCLQNLNDINAIVKTLTFDGAASNISMMKYLGVDFNNDMEPKFQHPSTLEDVHIFLDAAHMLKLVRNTLGDLRIIYDFENKAIDWSLFIKLVDLQESGGLHVATKLRHRHINYYKEKMKVKLAAQTFSASVADALTYCKNKNFIMFENSDPTIKFCKYINNIFDFLNTRNFISKMKYKRPLFINQEHEILEFVNDAIHI